MEITNVHVSIAENGRMKAFASITIDHEFIVHDLRIIEGTKGLFVAMPSKKTPSGTFRDIAHPITQNFRDKVEEAVINEYYRVLNELADQEG